MNAAPEPKAGEAPALGTTTIASALAFIVTLAAVLLGFNGCKASWACGTDVSSCATTHHKDGVFRGRIRRVDGRAIARPVHYIAGFGSLRDRPPLRLSTSAAGEFCIRWAEEGPPTITPLGSVVNGRRLYADIPPTYWRPLNGRPTPRGCSDPSSVIPWNRARDLTSRPQYVTTMAFCALPLILALLAIAVRGRWRRRLVYGSAAACACAVLATAVVWA